MNPLTNVRNIQNLNKRELELGVKPSQSWHQQYKDSAWIFIGGLDYDLTEGDLICVFSQYGEVVNINLVRDKKTGKSKGFAFLCYENQLSTVLSVDNLNSIKLCGRTVRVDHVEEYKVPKMREDMAPEQQKLALEGCAPQLLVDREISPEPSQPTLNSSKESKDKPKLKEEPLPQCQVVEGLVLPQRLFGGVKKESKVETSSYKKEKKQKKSKKSKKSKKKSSSRSRHSRDSNDSHSESSLENDDDTRKIYKIPTFDDDSSRYDQSNSIRETSARTDRYRNTNEVYKSESFDRRNQDDHTARSTHPHRKDDDHRLPITTEPLSDSDGDLGTSRSKRRSGADDRPGKRDRHGGRREARDPSQHRSDYRR